MPIEHCPYIESKPNKFFIGHEEYCTLCGKRLSDLHIKTIRTMCYGDYEQCETYSYHRKKMIKESLHVKT